MCFQLSTESPGSTLLTLVRLSDGSHFHLDTNIQRRRMSVVLHAVFLLRTDGSFPLLAEGAPHCNNRVCCVPLRFIPDALSIPVYFLHSPLVVLHWSRDGFAVTCHFSRSAGFDGTNNPLLVFSPSLLMLWRHMNGSGDSPASSLCFSASILPLFEKQHRGRCRWGKGLKDGVRAQRWGTWGGKNSQIQACWACHGGIWQAWSIVQERKSLFCC